MSEDVFSIHRFSWRIVFLSSLAFGVVQGRFVWAQRGSALTQRSVSPSQASPSNRLLQSFGRVGGSYYDTQHFQYKRSVNDLSTTGFNPAARDRARRQSAAQRGRSGSMMGGRMSNWAGQRMRGSSLLGRQRGYSGLFRGTRLAIPSHGGQLLSSVGRATFKGWSRYQNAFQYPRELGVVATKYAYWGAPEFVAKRSESTSQINLGQEQEDVTIPAPKISLQERVKNNLSSRRKVYEIRAKEAFKAGDYHRACAQLELALATIVDEYDEQMYLKLVHIYASIASEQYNGAMRTIVWVASENPATGGLRNPQILNRFRNVGSFYGDREEYETHRQKLTTFLEAQPQGPKVLAMRAFLAWGVGDVAEATFYARQILDSNAPVAEGADVINRLRRLHEMMQQAQQVSQAKETESTYVPVP